MQSGRHLKNYGIISPDGDAAGVLSINPNAPACSDQVLPPLTLMLAHASSRESLEDGEYQLLAMALKKFKVTADEVFTAFWRAYADPYVSQGKIEFRHLWKHIEAERNKEPEPPYFQRL